MWLEMSKEKKFFEAANYGSIELFNALLKQVDINCKDDIGQTALHIVATYGNLLKAKSLLEKEAIPTTKDDDGYTPLTSAVSHMIFEGRAFLDYTGVILALIKAGDNPTSLDVLYAECDDNTEESLNTIKLLDRVVRFINLINEGLNEKDAIAISMNQDPINSDDTSHDESDTTTLDYNHILHEVKRFKSGSEEILFNTINSEGLRDAVIVMSNDRSTTESDDQSSGVNTDYDSPESSPNKKSKNTHDTENTANQRSSQANIENKDADSNKGSNKGKQKTHESDTEERSSIIGLVIEELYSWLSELPEWLQNQILNSSPVKSMIENAEHMASIYDHKSMNIDFANKKTESDFTFTDNDELLTDNINGKIEIHNMSLSNPFETDMILTEHNVKYDILPIDMGINIDFAISGNIPVLGFNVDFHGQGIMA
jgi:hypothetical protein